MPDTDDAPQIALIAAMARNRVIGRDNQLPWHLPADMKHFRETTRGHSIIMGRKTWDSIGRPLPGRKNIVLTVQPGWQAEGVTVAGSLDQALASSDSQKVFIIGGQQIYQLAFPRAQQIYLTVVETEAEGDAYFPEFDESAFTCTTLNTVPADEANAYGIRFLRYDRR